MSELIELTPAAAELATLVRSVADAQLADPTPCPAFTVADLLDHIGGLSFAFTAAASKQSLPPDQSAPMPDGSRLSSDWHDAIPRALESLARAWSDPAAFQGITQAGPVELPGAVAAAVALNELTVHAWDLAAATGQSYRADAAAVAASQGFVDSFEPPEGVPADGGGLFGPPVTSADDTSPLDRLIAATGRNPAWRP